MTRVVAVRAGLGNSTAGTATTLSVGAGGALISGGLGLSMQYAGVISDLSSFNTAAIGNLTVTGNSFLLLSNANTFTGTTSIVGANSLLQLGNSLALQDSTLSTSGGGGVSFGTLTAATLGGLTGSQNLTLTNTALGGVALTIGNNGGTFSGDLSGNGSLVMHGTGTEVLNDATYTGATTLYQGNLTIGGSSDIVGAGNIDLVGAFGTNSGYGNTLTVTGNAIINTTGTIFLASNDGQNGANSPGLGVLLVTGTSSVTAGNLDLGNGSRTPAGTSVTISQSGTLDILGTISLEHTIGSTVGPNSVNLNSGTLAVGNFIFGVGNGTTQYANINFNGGTLEALANDPTGSYFLVEPTNSTTAIDTIINAGALINTNGFNITIATALTHGTGTPDGGLTLSDTAVTHGSLTLTNVNTYTGPTTINSGGTLQLGNGTSGFDGTITTSSGITDNGTLVYNRFGALTSGVAINGTGAVIKIGAGTQTLSASNGYTGATTVSGGTLIVTGGLTATSAVNVNSGDTLSLQAANALNSAAPLTLTAGTLQTMASQSEALGNLTLGAGASTLTLGATGSIIDFADSSALTWNGTLAINDWTGISAGGGSDEVFIGTSADLTPAQLADITFVNGSLNGSSFTSLSAVQLADGEIVAVPEPGTWAMLLAGAAMLGVWQRSRRRYPTAPRHAVRG